MSRNESIIMKSKVMYDFIAIVQVAIVFGYTALEAFANLSIPQGYEYKANINSKGIIGIFDKNAIERWVTLRTKMSEIYLKKDFFRVCDVPEQIIVFFYEELKGRDKTNSLWPWIINADGGLLV